jgi:hypothetical protein
MQTQFKAIVFAALSTGITFALTVAAMPLPAYA